MGRQSDVVAALLKQLHPTHGKLLPESAWEGRLVEAIVLSTAGASERSMLSKMRSLRRTGASIATFDEQAPHARVHLWDRLVLRSLFFDGLRVDDLEDAPDGFQEVENVVAIVHDRKSQRGVDGFFVEDFGDVYLDSGAAPAVIPGDLPPLAIQQREWLERTPLVEALSHRMWTSTGRARGLDDHSQAAQFDLPNLSSQFPSFGMVKDKVERYCLAPTHEDKKYLGFRAGGYGSSEEHVSLLAALLCSALYRPFPALDVEATSDGALQFVVPVSLPTFGNSRLTVKTAWRADESGLRMTTAFVVDPDVFVELTEPLDIWPDFGNFSSLSQQLGTVPVQAASAMTVDRLFATARVWVPHASEVGRAFVQFARKGGAVGSTFSRAAYGGRVTPMRIGSNGVVSEARATCLSEVARLVFAAWSIPVFPEVVLD
jgi:hypothetical protein